MPDCMGGPLSDEELACRAQVGCAASFDELVRRLQVPLLHFLQRRVAASDAEDLVQDTFVRAYENLHRYRSRWRFNTWLLTIARRLSANHCRRAQPVADSESVLVSSPSAAREPIEIAIAEEGRQRLWDMAAAVLSEEQMTAMWLYYVEEMSARQIARVLGRSRVAVKAMMFRARRKLLPLARELEFDGVSEGPISSPGPGFSPWRGEASHV